MKKKSTNANRFFFFQKVHLVPSTLRDLAVVVDPCLREKSSRNVPLFRMH